MNHARNQLAIQRRELERLRREHNNWQHRKRTISSQLGALSRDLVELRGRQTNLGTLTERIRKLIRHLASFLSKTSALYDALKELVSFDLLIEPFNSILKELIDNGVKDQGLIEAIRVSSDETRIASISP